MSQDSRSFSLATLGCRANQADSSRLRAILLGAGFQEKAFGEPVDCSIVNTCTVTAEADRKSRQLLTRALRLAPEAGQVVATGCAVAQRGGLKQLPGAVLRLPPEQREGVLSLLGAEACPGRESSPVVHRTTRALLKVQDGCDQFCTFCIVPYVRGRSQSVPLEQVVESARALEEKGYDEIVLTGIHLSIWGHDLPGEPDLSDLAAAILKATRTVRLRLASVEPDRFPLRLLELMAAEPDRLCPYLHLVLQHASDRILERMHRGYTLDTYRRIVDQFFDTVPLATLSSDIMVGFPGETEEDFRTLVRYIRSTPYYHLHVFPYSSRPGTAASKFDGQVPVEVKKERRDVLLRLGERKKTLALRGMIGLRTTVVFEGDHAPGWLKGTTHNGMAMVARAGAVLRKRQADVLVRRRLGANLVGEVL